MPDESTLKKLDEFCISACTSLLLDDCKVQKLLASDHFDYSGAPVACIDAGCEQFEVILTLNMPYSALAMTYPVADLATGEEELEDWIGELANRLLGKFNVCLKTQGHYVKTGLPQSDVGREYIQIFDASDSVYFFKHIIDVDGEAIQVSLQVEFFDNNLTFQDSTTDEEPDVESGALEFF